MAKEKKPVHKVQTTDGKRQIIQQLLQEYDIETAEDIENFFKFFLCFFRAVTPPLQELLLFCYSAPDKENP